MKWIGNHIEIEPPKRPKKLTGTRFATVMGLNPWSTPFEIWCAVTRTYEEPFEDTKYTLAGKAIEPKQAKYMKKAYAMYNLKTPTDLFGKDYFRKTYGDFFHDTPVLGGMWDYLNYDDEGNVDAVLEMKTTKRSEDWAEDIPEYYALQAALYAYLLGVDQVIMVASFLEDKDYDNPEGFEPSSANTITKEFKVSERYPDFGDKVAFVRNWWTKYVESGISPDYDEKKDADILKALRTNNLNPESDIKSMLAEAEAIKRKLEERAAETADDEKRLKKLQELIKSAAMESFREGDTKVSLSGETMDWVLSKTISTEVDKKKLEADGLLERYTVTKPKFTLTTKLKEDI